MGYDALKQQFERIFPEYASKFGSATSQAQVLEIQTQFVSEYREKLRIALHQVGIASSDDDVSVTIPVSLDYPKPYLNLINARGDEIEVQVQMLLDGVERLSKMAETSSPEAVTAQLIGFGSLAVGAGAGVIAFATLAGAVIVTEELTITAALAGVIAIGVAGTVAAAALVIGLAFLPFLYFMKKPAICMIILINELEQNIFFDGDYNIHGKPTLITREIGKALQINNKIFTNGGLFSTSKRDDALYGTQYGFVMRYGAGTKLSFATECPLSSTYAGNNCYCSFDETAEVAAQKTTKNNQTYFAAEKNGIKIEHKMQF